MNTLDPDFVCLLESSLEFSCFTYQFVTAVKPYCIRSIVNHFLQKFETIEKAPVSNYKGNGCKNRTVSHWARRTETTSEIERNKYRRAHQYVEFEPFFKKVTLCLSHCFILRISRIRFYFPDTLSQPPNPLSPSRNFLSVPSAPESSPSKLSQKCEVA